MQFRDLNTQYKVIKNSIDKAIQDVLNEGNYIMGKQVLELEKMLSEYVGVKHCITCGNGTDALTLALMAYDVKENDAVFIPDFTFFATGEVVCFQGATPIFVDIDKDTFNIDTIKLEESIIKVKEEGKLNLKAVIAVDLFGLPANYEELEEIVEKHGLILIEDAAQGFGGNIKGKKACSFGNIATTSFFPAKPLGCYGDGGAIFTNDDKIADLIRSYRIHGKGNDKYDNIRIGMNSRLDTIQAAILIEKFKKFINYELDKVNEIAKIYTNNLSGIVKTPNILDGYYSSWAQYSIILENKQQRDKLKLYLEQNDIPSMIYYPKPMSKQIAFRDIVYINDCIISKNTCDRILSIPMHPYLKIEEILFISNTINKFILTYQ